MKFLFKASLLLAASSSAGVGASSDAVDAIPTQKLPTARGSHRQRGHQDSRRASSTREFGRELRQDHETLIDGDSLSMPSEEADGNVEDSSYCPGSSPDCKACAATPAPHHHHFPIPGWKEEDGCAPKGATCDGFAYWTIKTAESLGIGISVEVGPGCGGDRRKLESIEKGHRVLPGCVKRGDPVEKGNRAIEPCDCKTVQEATFYEFLEATPDSCVLAPAGSYDELQNLLAEAKLLDEPFAAAEDAGIYWIGVTKSINDVNTDNGGMGSRDNWKNLDGTPASGICDASAWGGDQPNGFVNVGDDPSTKLTLDFLEGGPDGGLFDDPAGTRQPGAIYKCCAPVITYPPSCDA